jgi:hypothetical protein
MVAAKQAKRRTPFLTTPIEKRHDRPEHNTDGGNIVSSVWEFWGKVKQTPLPPLHPHSQNRFRAEKNRARPAEEARKARGVPSSMWDYGEIPEVA